MKTKAAVLYQINQPLQIEEIEIPELQKGQVLVRLLASGVCRSQINEWKGFKGPDKFLPHLMGHEGSGIVEAIGPGVKKVKKKDYVVLTWIKGKGRDAPSSQYRKDGQIINSGAVATFTQHAVVSENRLVSIPKAIPPDVAALLGCAMPTGAGIVLNTLQAKKNTSVAVIGVGGIGASAILAAKMAGCQQIIAVDIHDSKLEFAKKLGATQTVNSLNKGRFTLLSEIGSVDYVVEASGAKEAMELAYEIAKDQGIAVIAGNLKKNERITIDPFDLIKGKRIIGTWGGETQPDRDIPKYARAYQSGKLDLEKLITHRFSLEQINTALQVLLSGQAGRVMLTIASK